MKHGSVSGTGYINFRDNYNATILAQLKACFFFGVTCPWCDIESLHIPGHNLSVWLLSAPQVKKVNMPISPTITATATTLNYFITNASKGHSPCKLPLPVSILSYLSVIYSCEHGRTRAEHGYQI